MIDLRPFEPSDLAAIELQPQQAAEMSGLGGWQELGEKLIVAGPAWTVLHRGRVMGCGGLGVAWRGRAEAWCFVSSNVPRTLWPAVHRAVVRILATAERDVGLRRIEATCAYGWPPGRRWLEMLGFAEWSVARAYSPDGRDFWRCARVTA